MDAMPLPPSEQPKDAAWGSDDLFIDDDDLDLDEDDADGVDEDALSSAS